MAIKIEMLRCFRAVADHGSLAEAARTLVRTPSAVSMMLKQFEEHVGAALFESARKSRLTPLGELIHAGVGSTLLPRLAVLPGFEDLAFLPLLDSTARREVWMVTPQARLPTPAPRAMVEALRAAQVVGVKGKLQTS